MAATAAEISNPSSFGGSWLGVLQALLVDAVVLAGSGERPLLTRWLQVWHHHLTCHLTLTLLL